MAQLTAQRAQLLAKGLAEQFADALMEPADSPRMLAIQAAWGTVLSIASGADRKRNAIARLKASEMTLAYLLGRPAIRFQIDHRTDKAAVRVVEFSDGQTVAASAPTLTALPAPASD